MKKLLSVLLLLVFLTCSCVACSNTDENYVMDRLETRIDIGLGQEFTILHMTDSHLTLADKNDTRLVRGLARSRKKYFNHQEEKLAYITKFSQENSYPIVHSGDLIDYISHANLLAAENFLKNSGNDILLYTAGNHEFCKNIGDPDDDTVAYRNQSLDKINAISTNDVRFFVAERGGITFIGLDNSYHSIDETQLSSLKNAVSATNNPVVLVMHAPLYEESLYNYMMQDNDSAYLMAVPEDKLAYYPEYRYTTQKADETTYAAYDYILGEKKIVAVLAGHLHRNYESALTDTLMQYVIDTDTFRLVTFY